jgi:gliding motility-associated-like protein
LRLYFTILLLIKIVFSWANDSTSTNQKFAITLTITKTNSTCNKWNGRVYIVASGGIAPYEYSLTDYWGNGGTNNTGVFAKVSEGAFSVTVVDAIGTSVTQTDVLANTFTAPRASAVVNSAPTGCNLANGSIRVIGTGGLPPYLYSIDNITYQPSNIFGGLTEGIYENAVKDANGCTSIDPIIQSNSLTLRNANNPQQCPFQINGILGNIQCIPFYSIQYGIPRPSYGGTPPFLYSRDDINYQTSNEFPNLTAGLQIFYIKDALGIKITYSVSLLEPCVTNFIVSTQLQPAQCGVNGSITVAATNGVGPYTYSLDGINFQTNNVFSGLTPGFYTITVKDADGFLTLRYVEIKNSCTVALANVTNSSCGNANGKIEVTGANGIAPYTYSLDGVNYSNNTTYTNLLANNYRAYAKDANNKIGFADVVVVDIAGAVISNTTIKNSGCENKTGEITVTGTGGATPYQYNINGGSFQTSNTFTNLSSTSYTLGIKDGNGCVTTANAFVPLKPDLLLVNLGTDKTLCEDETTTLDATNTSATYQWQDNSTNPTYNVTAAGNYFVTVTKDGCVAKDTVTINYNLKPRFSLGADMQICVGTTITLDPKIDNVSYLWQDGSTQKIFTARQAGLYKLTATNFCGSTTNQINLLQGVCEFYIPNSFTPNNDGKNDVFRAGYGDNVIEYEMQIFNRYGQLLFVTKDKNRGWDGSVNGTKQPQGAYTWVIQYRIRQTVQPNVMQGTLLLLR